MPPAQHMEILAGLGVCVGVAVFTIMAMLLGVVALCDGLLRKAINKVGRR